MAGRGGGGGAAAGAALSATWHVGREYVAPAVLPKFWGYMTRRARSRLALERIEEVEEGTRMGRERVRMEMRSRLRRVRARRVEDIRQIERTRWTVEELRKLKEEREDEERCRRTEEYVVREEEERVDDERRGGWRRRWRRGIGGPRP